MLSPLLNPIRKRVPIRRVDLLRCVLLRSSDPWRRLVRLVAVQPTVRGQLVPDLRWRRRQDEHLGGSNFSNRPSHLGRLLFCRMLVRGGSFLPFLALLTLNFVGRTTFPGFVHSGSEQIFHRVA